MIALFDRAAARDFLDVFADMLDSLASYRDTDLAFPDMEVDLRTVREFFSNWTTELRSGSA